MEERLHIRPLGPIARLADTLMLIPMWGLSVGMYLWWGAWESPQLTHRWNWVQFPLPTVKGLNPNTMVHSAGVPGAIPRAYRFVIPIFHIPIIGGWRDYIVLEPVDDTEEWYVGWVVADHVGVSRIPSRGPKRVTRGPGDISFFGIRAADNAQVQITQRGAGRIGDGGPYRRIPLF